MDDSMDSRASEIPGPKLRGGVTHVVAGRFFSSDVNDPCNHAFTASAFLCARAGTLSTPKTSASDHWLARAYLGVGSPPE